MDIRIREGRLDDALHVLNEIPEFENLPDEQAVHRRLDQVPHLILTAYAGQQVAGCKIGYERDGRFYSWLGAVRPEYRSRKVASLLAEYQESWARQKGYTAIWMKTRNCFPEMLLMAIRRGFRITALDPREEIAQNRIILEKAV
jgi:predicted GNAT superfamily acetyltransferase